jgi:hypothetical protein
MRGRIATGALILLITLVFIFTPRSAYPTSIRGGYPYVKPKTTPWHPPTVNEPAANPPPKQLIVKTQLEGEDLNWLLKLLPEWRNQIITIDKKFAHLHDGAQRVDKGRIANAYLTWLIENYNNLAETIIFVPPALEQQQLDKEQWRIPNKQLISAIQTIQLPHVQKSGFAPLLCPTEALCQDLILPFRSPPNEFRTLEVAMSKAWSGLFNNTNVPEQLAAPSGSAFAVSKTQVLKRSVDEYMRYWTWLSQTKMDDDTAGLVVERLWHVVFGKEAVFCPAEKQCECDVFGRC